MFIQYIMCTLILLNLDFLLILNQRQPFAILLHNMVMDFCFNWHACRRTLTQTHTQTHTHTDRHTDRHFYTVITLFLFSLTIESQEFNFSVKGHFQLQLCLSCSRVTIFLHSALNDRFHSAFTHKYTNLHTTTFSALFFYRYLCAHPINLLFCLDPLNLGIVGLYSHSPLLCRYSQLSSSVDIINFSHHLISF